MGMNVGKYRLPLYEMEGAAKEYLIETMRILFHEGMREAV
jgi:hypothetical protein